MRDQSPLARKESLIIKELPEETLVYDRQTDEAHCLNLTAAQVWKNCDGKRTVAELQQVLAAETKADVPEEVVWLALEQLEKFKLLENGSAKAFHLPGMTRRDLMRRIGIATVALPLVVSITAPTANAQTSLLPPGRCCGNPNECASDDCRQGGCTPPPPAQPSSKFCF